MNEITTSNNIENLIYEVRGKQIMLDSDLANIYECKNGTKSINLAVKRNINKFPKDFRFQLTKEEALLCSRFQNETLNILKRGSNIKYLPYAYTQEGVAMLATVLNTAVASQVSINIMRAFVKMRKYLSNDLIELSYMKKQILNNSDNINKNTQDIKLLQESFAKFNAKQKVNEIYFNGQIFDAYSKILDIFKMAKNSLIVIDAYADNTLLDIIKRLNIKVFLITKPHNLLPKQDIEKYNKQYHNLNVYYDNTFHDRYFILDNNIIYHCGASVNRIGYKTFSITLISDKDIGNALLNKIASIV